MEGVYHPRHPEKTVFYRVIFHSFEEFVSVYEERFEREYGCFRPVVKEVVEKYLDCGNPKCGFARIRCSDCGAEYLLTFSCKTRGFCPSFDAKRLEEWGEWMREKLINLELVQKILQWRHSSFSNLIKIIKFFC